MRIASLTVFVWCAFASVPSVAYELRLPADTSFITKLADAAIDAEVAEAARDRGQSRRMFQEAFLGGWLTNLDVVTSSQSQFRYSTRLHIKGWLEGMNYRSTRPDSAAEIMREYGYTKFEGTGSWQRGPGIDSLRLDEATMRTYGVTGRSCVDLTFIYNDEIRAKIRLPEEVLIRGITASVKLIGYISPEVKYKPASPEDPIPLECERKVVAADISVIAR